MTIAAAESIFANAGRDCRLAKAFADLHPGLEFDAVLIDAAATGGQVRGRIYLDQKGRFLDGEVVTTSRIATVEEGGRIVVTRNTRYLVQHACETEADRREASLAPGAGQPTYMYGEFPA